MADPDPYPSRLCKQHYEGAVKLFDNGEIEKCIAEAKHNLSDPNLPPFYIIKNCILVACALDDWTDADRYRLSAEQAYLTTLQVTPKEDTQSLEALQDLRVELDELDEFRRQDLTAMANAQRDEMDEMDAGDFEEEEMFAIEDEEGVAMAENADEVAAEALALPIRTEHDPTKPNPYTPALNVVLPTDSSLPSSTPQPKLRYQKSQKFSKGGAYHAHDWSKSYGRNSGSQARASLKDMKWADEAKDKDDKEMK